MTHPHCTCVMCHFDFVAQFPFSTFVCCYWPERTVATYLAYIEKLKDLKLGDGYGHTGYDDEHVQVYSELREHIDRCRKTNTHICRLEETSTRKLERTTNQTQRTTNVNRTPSTKNTSEDTHVSRETAEDSGSGIRQSNTTWYWQTRSFNNKTTTKQHVTQQNTASNSTTYS